MSTIANRICLGFQYLESVFEYLNLIKLDLKMLDKDGSTVTSASKLKENEKVTSVALELWIG